MNKKFGVDISRWQKGINLEQVKKGERYVNCKN